MTFFLKYFQGDLVKQFKDNNVNKDDAEFKQAINELKLRKKALEDQVKRKICFPREILCLFFSRLQNGCLKKKVLID